MAASIDTSFGFDDVKVGSLVYCKRRFDADWQTGLVVEKYDFHKDVSAPICFRVLVEGEVYYRFSLRQLLLIETGEK